MLRSGEGSVMIPKSTRTARAHAALAAAVRDYLDECPERRVTLAELETRFHVSGTQIKSAYRETFGASLYADTKRRKMLAAAEALRQTDRTVLEIAGSLGYDNASKFAAAFRSIHGVSPTEYRGGREKLGVRS